MEGQIHYIGLLSNVDSSIQKIKFQRGFKVGTMNIKEAYALFSKLLDMESYQVLGMLTRYQSVGPTDDAIYYMSNSMMIKPGGSTTSDPYGNIPAFEHDKIDNYLMPILKLMRLYQGGNITIPYHIYYRLENNIPQLVADWGWTAPTKSLPFRLMENEMKELDEFIQRTKYPFNRPFLQLAFENFELSYEIPHLNVEFLILMIGLEILFNPGDHELRNRISRNAAVLLGNDSNDSQTIYDLIKNLYDKRSDLVHNGTNSIDQTDLTNIRNYVRNSIKILSSVDKNKNDVLNTLNILGFGSKPF